MISTGKKICFLFDKMSKKINAAGSTQNLNEKRKSYYNKLKDDVRQYQLKIRRCEFLIQQVQTSTSVAKDPEYVERQIELNTSKISEFNEIIAQLNGKMMTVMDGGCDKDIEAMYQASSEHLDKEAEKAFKKEQAALEREKRDQARGRAFGDSEYQEQRSERYKKKQVEREYERFLDIVDSLPDSLKANLETMPNNKGYRWRGAIFWGKLPAEEGGQTLVFEKRSEGMYISETVPGFQMQWLKKRDGEKQLLSKHRRRLNFNAPATVY